VYIFWLKREEISTENELWCYLIGLLDDLLSFFADFFYQLDRNLAHLLIVHLAGAVTSKSYKTKSSGIAK
jgi:amino acid permease